MTPAAMALTDLGRRRPEWQPWLCVVEEAVREFGGTAWDRAVPAAPGGGCGRPLLSGAAVLIPSDAARRLLNRLARVASRSGTPAMATLAAAVEADIDLPALFAASVCHDTGRLGDAGTAAGVDPEAFAAVAILLAAPFLQACQRRWSEAVPPAWTEGFCPLCASWPSFAEVRGIERSRYFRCGRCGCGWHAHHLRCPYCGTRDHDELATLVVEREGEAATLEACRRCRGYVKTFSRLQGCQPGTVMVDDLASVDLDVAALERGYTRPAGAGCAFEVTVTGRPAPWRLFAGRA